MACQITITSVIGLAPPGGIATSITVAGTAVDCKSKTVVVRLTCNGGAPHTGEAPVDAAGNWSVTVTNLNCKCGGPVRVRASCKDDDACETTISTELKCQPGPDDGCPTVVVTAEPGPCNADGTRTVTLTATFISTGGGTAVAQWSFGDGANGVAFSVSAPGTSIPQDHNYLPPGPYTATLNIILPAGCPPVTVTVGPLDPCPPPACPEVVNLAATVSGCAGGGSAATVTFTGTLAPPGSGCTFLWHFGDGSPDVTTTVPSTTHSFTTSGVFAVAVIAQCGPSCTKVTTVTVTVPPCCPVVTGIAPTVSGCANGAGTSATVTLVATTNPASSPGTFVWTYSEGPSPVTTAAPTDTHSFPTSGNKPVSVSYKPSQPGCPATTATTSVAVPACNGNPPPPPNGGEGGGCRGLRWTIAILLILSALALYIGLCVPGTGNVWFVVSAGLALTAAILGVLWGIFCPKPCGWAYLLGWQVALGSGIGALYFAPCCAWLWILGAVLISTAIGLMIAWIKACKKSSCDVLIELSVVLTVVIVPVLGWLAGIPFLSACLNPIVAGAVSTLAAAVALGVANCAASAH